VWRGVTKGTSAALSPGVRQPLQRRSTAATPADRTDDRAGAGSTLPKTTLQMARHGVSGPGTTLPQLDAVQRSFGPDHDVSGVRAHTDGAAQEASRSMGAAGYAVGNDVAFASESPGLFLIAHEAAHVVQQRAGVQLSGGVGAEGDPYEQHADRVAAAVVAGESAAGLLDRIPGGGGGGGAVQRRAEEGTWADIFNNAGVELNNPDAFKEANTRERHSMLERADVELAAQMLATVSRFEVKKLLLNTVVRPSRSLTFKIIEACPDVVEIMPLEYLEGLFEGGGKLHVIGEALSAKQVDRIATAATEYGRLAQILKTADAERVRIALGALFYREEAQLIVDLHRYRARGLDGALGRKSVEQWTKLLDAAHDESPDLGNELIQVMHAYNWTDAVEHWQRQPGP
jgi:hypothetical protein